MRSDRFTVPGATGQPLSARTDSPDSGESSGHVLFAHHFLGSLSFKPYTTIAQAFTAAGFTFTRFDFTGLGESGGSFEDTTFSTNVEDLLAVARHLQELGRGPDVLLGHSLGGAAMLQAAPRLPQVGGVATVGAPFSPAHVTHLFGAAEEEIVREGHATVQLAGRRITVRRAFLEDLVSYQAQLLTTLRTLGKALLIFHSPQDRTVSIDNAAEIYRAARHPKSFVSLDRADHLLLAAEDARFVGEMAAAWARRHARRFPDGRKFAAGHAMQLAAPASRP